MGPKLSFQPVLKAEAIQEESKATQEETKNIRSPYPPTLDLTTSSQSALNAETIQEMDGTSQLLILPSEVLLGILRHLDMKTLISRLTMVCKLFCPFCEGSPGVNNPFLGYIGYIYETLMLSRGDPVFEPIPKGGFQPVYFRSNVNLSLSLGGVAQPMGLHIHAFTTSNPKEIRLHEICSMVMSFTLNNPSETVRKRASQFLAKLFATGFDNLRCLKLSGFRVDNLLWEPLLNLSLDWLHLTFRSISIFIPDSQLSWKFKRLHLKLEKDCFMTPGQCIAPSPLEELSLRFSNLVHHLPVAIPECKSLKKM
jgi:hypothetical protein